MREAVLVPVLGIVAMRQVEMDDTGPGPGGGIIGKAVGVRLNVLGMRNAPEMPLPTLTTRATGSTAMRQVTEGETRITDCCCCH